MIALGANALQVTGTASINGGVRVHGFVSGYVPQSGSRQDLVHAAGGLSGTFSSPATSSGLQGLSLLQSSYGYDSNNAWLNLAQVSVTSAASGLSASAQAAAQRLDGAFNALDRSSGLQGSAFGAAAGALQWTGGGRDGLAASLQSLSGQAHARAESATFDSIDMSRRAIAERFARVQAAPRLRGTW
ncbi:hypothetical protein G6F35_016445 [Rhizopus arrhizus]|nr:hypothetical protein G6F35_016445 [Rhizopus arrhizus]